MGPNDNKKRFFFSGGGGRGPDSVIGNLGAAQQSVRTKAVRPASAMGMEGLFRGQKKTWMSGGLLLPRQGPVEFGTIGVNR